ncbi:hypothetical protein R5R35_014276 [Gryllus longicercus]|uniref:Uncharacterized protein n=1 Tax=Gryllus longicercus TaxID=2509291 RepID=A0AAN9VVY7_9ORTH
MKYPPREQFKKKFKIKSEKLRMEENRKIYDQAIEERLKMKQGEVREGIEEEWKRLKERILEAAIKVYGRQRVNTCFKRTRWCNKVVKEWGKKEKKPYAADMVSRMQEVWEKYIENRNRVKHKEPK